MGRLIGIAGGATALIVFALGGPLEARDVTVPRTQRPAKRRPSSVVDIVKVTVTPPPATSCPQRFVFVATIKARAATALSYTWERSDSATAPTESVYIDAGSHEVSTYWLLGSARPSGFDGWERLHILSPEDVVSAPAEFRVRCPVDP
jgi:hypothetical protein